MGVFLWARYPCHLSLTGYEPQEVSMCTWAAAQALVTSTATSPLSLPVKPVNLVKLVTPVKLVIAVQLAKPVKLVLFSVKRTRQYTN